MWSGLPTEVSSATIANLKEGGKDGKDSIQKPKITAVRVKMIWNSDAGLSGFVEVKRAASCTVYLMAVTC